MPASVSAIEAWSERLKENCVACQEEDDKAHLGSIKFLYVDGYKCLSADAGSQTVRVWNVDTGEAVCELGPTGVVPLSCSRAAAGAVAGSFFEHVLSSESSTTSKTSMHQVWSEDESSKEVACLGATTNVVVIVMKDRIHNIHAYLWDYSFSNILF